MRRGACLLGWAPAAVHPLRPMSDSSSQRERRQLPWAAAMSSLEHRLHPREDEARVRPSRRRRGRLNDPVRYSETCTEGLAEPEYKSA